MALIPTYALYGESDLFPDVLHCESIQRRSALLGWSIKAHRHPDLHQFFWIATSGSSLRLEGEGFALPAGSALYVPPLAVHGFEFAANTQGWVVTAPRSILQEALGLERPLLKGKSDGALARLRQPLLERLSRDDPQWRRLSELFDALAEEHRGRDNSRPLALLSWLGLLAVWFARRAQANQEAAAPSRASDTKLALLHRFQQQVEAHYRNGLSLQDHARRLGVTATHLSRVCRGVLGHPASQLLRQRQLLEAKRALAYTTLSIAEVGYSLGFSDPAYFSRFFAKHCGESPGAYRKRANRPIK